MTSYEYHGVSISGNLTVYSTTCSDWQQRHQTTGLLALCEGKPPVTGGFPSQMPSNIENILICDVMTWILIKWKQWFHIDWSCSGIGKFPRRSVMPKLKEQSCCQFLSWPKWHKIAGVDCANRVVQKGICNSLRCFVHQEYLVIPAYHVLNNSYLICWGWMVMALEKGRILVVPTNIGFRA